MKNRQFERVMRQIGWVMKERTGTNHRQYEHPIFGNETVSGNPGDEADKNLMRRILKDAASLEPQLKDKKRSKK
jgi:predicted RNA binding protein YcfA (HicA-like mRNA interferase family)